MLYKLWSNFSFKVALVRNSMYLPFTLFPKPYGRKVNIIAQE